MPIDRISFSTSQEGVNKIGLKSWRKFGAEYQIELGENLEDAKKALKDFVYASLKAQQDTVPEESIQVKDTPLDEGGRAIADILLCKTLDELKGFELISKQSNAVKAAYNQKLKQLQNV